jgi:hypothetical protein
MSKPSKPLNKICSRQLFTAQPWRCEHHSTHSEVKGYVEASGTWETLATIHTNAGASAESISTFITGIVNDAQMKIDPLAEALEALELVDHEGLTFAAEKKLSQTVNHVRRIFL